MFELSQSFSNISSLAILVDVQRFQENGKGILCVGKSKWLCVRLQTKWLWNGFLLQKLKLQMLRLLHQPVKLLEGKEFLDIQTITKSTFTLKRVCDMIRTDC